jgi:hypothetical protein
MCGNSIEAIIVRSRSQRPKARTVISTNMVRMRAIIAEYIGGCDPAYRASGRLNDRNARLGGAEEIN